MCSKNHYQVDKNTDKSLKKRFFEQVKQPGFYPGLLAGLSVAFVIFVLANLLIAHKIIEWKYNNIFSQNSQINKKSDSENITPEYIKNIAQNITVKVLSGDSWGSGIIIEKKDKFYTVLTNGHVLGNGHDYKIQTHDEKTHDAQLLFRLDEGERGDDLAVLQFSSSESYEIAKLNLSELKEEDRVFATGFPSSQNGLISHAGSVTLVLDRARKEGYQIAYSIDIEKGMSGGPLLNPQGELIGINGKHKPLWGGLYLYKDDSQLTQPREELDGYSWAIPIETFVRQAPPSLLANMTLNPPMVNEPKTSKKRLIEASYGNVQAKISGRLEDNVFTKVQLTLMRSGKTLLKKNLPEGVAEKIRYLDLQVVDLDKDENPEVIVDLTAGDDSLYSYSLIYHYAPERVKYLKLEHSWGPVDRKPSYKLKDFNKDGILEFESFNRKFAREFVADNNVNYTFPLQIWQYNRGEIRDVTRDRQYRQVLYNHTLLVWRDYLVRRNRKQDIKGVLAVYLAEKYLDDKGEEGWQRLKEAYKEDDGEKYFEQLRSLLKAMEYTNQNNSSL